MSQRRKLLRMQRFCLLQSHSEWLDAQAQVGINDSRIAQAAVSEFLYEIQEEERQWWITDARAELPARTPTIDVIVNASLSQFIGRHHAEFLESPRAQANSGQAPGAGQWQKKNLPPVSIPSSWAKLFGWSVESSSGSLDEPPDTLQTLWATSFCYAEHSRVSVPRRQVDAESATLLRVSPDQIV